MKQTSEGKKKARKGRKKLSIGCIVALVIIALIVVFATILVINMINAMQMRDILYQYRIA